MATLKKKTNNKYRTPMGNEKFVEKSEDSFGESSAQKAQTPGRPGKSQPILENGDSDSNEEWIEAIPKVRSEDQKSPRVEKLKKRVPQQGAEKAAQEKKVQSRRRDADMVSEGQYSRNNNSSNADAEDEEIHDREENAVIPPSPSEYPMGNRDEESRRGTNSNSGYGAHGLEPREMSEADSDEYHSASDSDASEDNRYYRHRSHKGARGEQFVVKVDTATTAKAPTFITRPDDVKAFKKLVNWNYQMIMAGKQTPTLAQCAHERVLEAMANTAIRVHRFSNYDMRSKDVVEIISTLSGQELITFLVNTILSSNAENKVLPATGRQQILNLLKAMRPKFSFANLKATDAVQYERTKIVKDREAGLLTEPISSMSVADASFVQELIETAEAIDEGFTDKDRLKKQKNYDEESASFARKVHEYAKNTLEEKRADGKQYKHDPHTLEDFFHGWFLSANRLHAAWQLVQKEQAGEAGADEEDSSGSSDENTNGRSSGKSKRHKSNNGNSKPDERRDTKKQKQEESKPAQTNDYAPKCFGCGVKGHKSTDCPHQQHIDWNNTGKPWSKSEVGMQYARLRDAKGQPCRTLPLRSKLTKNKKALEAYTIPVPGRSKSELPSGDELSDHCDEQPCCGVCRISKSPDKQLTRRVLTLPENRCTMYSDVTMDGDLLSSNADGSVVTDKINIALDSQSVPSNFINYRVRNLLGAGARIRKLNTDNKVCSCFTNECRSVSEEVEFTMRVYHNKSKKYKYFNILAYVIDSPQDVTIGTQALQKSDKLRGYLNDMLLLHRGTEASQINTCEEINSEEEAEAHALTRLLNRKMTVIYRPVGIAVSVTGRDNRSKKLRRGITNRTTEQKEKAWHAGKSHVLVWDGDGADTYHAEEYAGTDEVVAKYASIKESGPDIAVSDLPSQIHGDAELCTDQKKLCEQFKDIFSRELRLEPAKIEPMTIVVDPAKWRLPENKRSQRIQSVVKTEETRNQVKGFLAAHVVEKSAASYHSQVLLVKKPNGTWRFCVDYRRLNFATKLSALPIPNITQLLERLGQKRAHYFAVFDMTKGYYQAPLEKSSRESTAFITSDGVYQWKRVAMGLCGAPGYFQQQMTHRVLSGLVYEVCEVYMDDIIIFGRTKEEYLKNLKKVMEALRKHNITVNPDKCRLGLHEIEFVGHTISREGKSFTRSKLQEVVDFPKPKTQGELRSFLGLANYFRDHIKNFSLITAPLHGLVQHVGYTKARVVRWTDETVGAFEQLKHAINECPTLFFADPQLPIHLYTDASDIGFGMYLCQRRANGSEIPIGFMSRTFNDVQRRWAVNEREAYGIYEGIKKFDYLIRDTKFTLHTDHANLTYIRDSGSPKVIRWKLELQEHDFDLVHVPGKDNVIADYLSRNPEAPVDGYIPSTEAVCKYLAWMRVEDTALEEAAEVARCNIRHTFDTIPEQQYQDIHRVHNEVEGHHGVATTMAKLEASGKKWPYQRQHVERFIAQCDTCQKMEEKHVVVNSRPYTTGGYRPHEQICIDTIGPLPEDEKGNKYAIVIIDSFSRFLAVYPTPNDDSTAAARALLQHMGTFLVTPCEIKSDRGAAFASGVITELMELVGSDRIETLAYSHQENSIVERANKEVNRWLRDCLYARRKKKEEWTSMIPFVTRIHNATVIATLGCSPADIIFGKAVTGDPRIFLPRTPTIDEEMDTYLARRLQDQETTIELAQSRQRKHHAEHMGSNPVHETEYAVDSYVLLAWPLDRLNLRRPTKLDTLY